MAERGARVLILERERQFRDRVRGEQVHPWGVAEARALGLYEALAAMGAHEVRWWSTYRGSDLVRRRDLVESSPHRAGSLNFYHPSMQETLLRLAATAGAEVRRGVTVTKVSPGSPPTVHVQGDSNDQTYGARLIIGADGRQSRVRHWGAFTISREEKWLAISGVLLDGMKAADDGNHTFRPSSFGQAALLFPLARGRFRAYLATGRRAEHRWARRAGSLRELCHVRSETAASAGATQPRRPRRIAVHALISW
jgi:menaquinone-9 beta-reductase